jgi:hypothetical protein
LQIVNDSTLTIVRNIVNKSDFDLYVPSFGGTLNHFDNIYTGIDPGSFIVQAGVFAPGVYMEIAPSLEILKPKDTVSIKRIVNVKTLKDYKQVVFSFDYLNPSKFEKSIKKEILKNIVIYPNSEDNRFLISRILYGKYCETMISKLPIGFKL